MQTHNLEQGSNEWHQFRLDHLGSSEAAAMLGISKNVTRTELLHMKKTGIAKEFSDWFQERILDRGHEVEAKARVIVERAIGEDLYPVTCSEGVYSASCDGLTMLEDTAFEHKQWNEELAASVRNGVLPEEYQPQCQQIMMVTGAGRVIFTVSDGTEERMERMEVTPDPEWFDRIRAGWAQFQKDLDAYQPEEKKPEAVGRVPDTLPALRIEVTGMVTASNLSEFKETALAVFRGINTDLQTDQDFADAEKAVKFCKDAEERLDAAKQHALSQTASIDELFRTVDSIKEEARTVRLKLDKLITAEKANRKGEIVSKASAELVDHIANLNDRIGGMWMPRSTVNFGDAIKGLKSLESMKDKVSTALANAKIEANATADLIEMNHKTVEDMSLFPDFAQVCTKSPEDFSALLAMRIGQRKEAEEKRLDAERERIRREEEAKARAAAEAEARAKRQEDSALANNVGHSKPVDIRATVIEHQDEISAFLATLDVDDKKKQAIRPYLVEFVKFQAGRVKVAA